MAYPQLARVSSAVLTPTSTHTLPAAPIMQLPCVTPPPLVSSVSEGRLSAGALEALRTALRRPLRRRHAGAQALRLLLAHEVVHVLQVRGIVVHRPVTRTCSCFSAPPQAAGGFVEGPLVATPSGRASLPSACISRHHQDDLSRPFSTGPNIIADDGSVWQCLAQPSSMCRSAPSKQHMGSRPTPSHLWLSATMTRVSESFSRPSSCTMSLAPPQFTMMMYCTCGSMQRTLIRTAIAHVYIHWWRMTTRARRCMF